MKMKKMQLMIACLVAGMGFVIAQAIPTAHANPNMCSINPGNSGWYNPCTAQYPPWNSPSWSPDGRPGTWGPGGYVPCTNEFGCRNGR